MAISAEEKSNKEEGGGELWTVRKVCQGNEKQPGGYLGEELSEWWKQLVQMFWDRAMPGELEEEQEGKWDYSRGTGRD